MSQSRRQSTWHTFFLRRLKRIYPPYLCSLVFVVLVVFIDRTFGARLIPTDLIPEVSNLSWEHWFGNLTLTETWRKHLIGTSTPLLLSPVAWTLCYEEQFYFVCGVCVVLFRRHYFLAIVLVTVIVLSNCLNLNIGPVRDMGLNLNYFDVRFGGTFLMGEWLDFALGCLVYWGIHIRCKPRSIALLCLAVTLAVLFLEAEPVFSSPNFWGKRVISLLTASLLLFLHRFDARVANDPRLYPLHVPGIVCYSLYLTHFPIVLLISGALQRAGITSELGTFLISLPLCLAGSALVGLVFFRVSEFRFLSHKQQVSAGAVLNRLRSWRFLSFDRLNVGPADSD